MTSEMDSAGADGWHELVLALAGQIGDSSVAAARATVEPSVRSQHVVEGAQAVGLSLTEEDLNALVASVVPGDAASIAHHLDRQGNFHRRQYTFTPFVPGPDGPEPVAAGTDDLSMFGSTAEPVDWSGLSVEDWTDSAISALCQAVAAEPRVRGLWGAWRRRRADDVPDDVGGSEPVRVFLVEVDGRSAVPVLTRQFQQVLVFAGEPGAQVEVYATGDSLPDYQRQALGSAALLWAQRAEAAPTLVPVFDEVDPQGGPRFSTEHLRLEPDERRHVAGYLYGAEAVLLTTATMVDLMDPDRGDVVPLSFRTDGAFVWPESVAYYVDQHGLEPHPPLLAAIRAAQYRPPRVDGVDLFRAENVLMQPSE